MTSCSDKIREIAKELEGYVPQMETFGKLDRKACMLVAIRMAVELLRERADEMEKVK